MKEKTIEDLTKKELITLVKIYIQQAKAFELLSVFYSPLLDEFEKGKKSV